MSDISMFFSELWANLLTVFSNEPLVGFVFIVSLWVIVMLLSRLDLALTTYFIRHYNEMPEGVRFAVTVFKPQVEVVVLAAWETIEKELAEVAFENEYKEDDSLFVDVANAIRNKIDQIDGVDNIPSYTIDAEDKN